jgi:hypothetical protein
VNAPTDALLGRAIEREDDLSLFFWLFGELERFEAQLEADPDARPETSEGHNRGLSQARATVATRPAED